MNFFKKLGFNKSTFMNSAVLNFAVLNSAILILAVSISFRAQAYDFPLKDAQTMSQAPSIAELLTFNLLEANFDGIVRLNNCSGSLVRYVNSQGTDKAMVLTNGHCFEKGMTEPNRYFANTPSTRRFSLLDNQGESIGTVYAQVVIYTSMTYTDITLYQLTETFNEIFERYRATPLTLVSNRPDTGVKVDIVSGYWRRGYDCTIEDFVHELREDRWTFKDSIRYQRGGCETIHGTSGSPVILAGTRSQVAIHNTGNDDGERCTMDNPCEIDQNGNVFFEKGLKYGQQTYWIYSCLNNQTLDLSVEGCMLFH